MTDSSPPPQQPASGPPTIHSTPTPAVPSSPPLDPIQRRAAAYALGFAVVVLLLAGIWLLFRPILLLLFAIVLATALQPLVNRLERVLPRLLAIILIYLALLGLIALGGALIAPTLIDQAEQLATNGPELVTELQQRLERLDPTDDGQITERLQSAVSSFGSNLATVPLTIVSAATELLLVVAMSLYWLIATPALRGFVLSLVPSQKREAASDILAEMGRSMGGYVRGALLDGIIMGAITFVGLLILGVDYAVVLALIVVIGELVPVIGPIAASIPAIAVGLTDSPFEAIKIGIFYLVIQQIESNVVEPNIMSRQTDMPALLVLFALLAGSSVAGILGAVVAIPVAGALRVLVLRVVAPAVRRWTGAEQPTI